MQREACEAWVVDEARNGPGRKKQISPERAQLIVITMALVSPVIVIVIIFVLVVGAGAIAAAVVAT